MKKLVGVLAVAVMALTGCGNTCDNLGDALTEFDKKAAPCGNNEPSTFNMSQCENNLDKCSSEDKKALDKFADCLGDLPTCATATEDNFNAAAAGCAFSLVGSISEQCLNTIGG
jgi:hypothetical protein